ncbi:MAG: Fic family protein [Chitinophagaceae bacterium]
MYLHQYKDWPNFTWDAEAFAALLLEARHKQGRILGRMEALGFNLQEEAKLETLALNVIRSGEIEGEILATDKVRSSLARKLGVPIAGMVPSSRHIDGLVDMMLDATRNFNTPLTHERLFGWQAALFPTGHSGMYLVEAGKYRTNTSADPMQIVSGALGREKVHYTAPDSALLHKEMTRYLKWFNKKDALDPFLKAAISHLWFEMVHPFDDGNGRVGRAIIDMQLAKADGTAQRFYSLTTQILKERKAYYKQLEKAGEDGLDITCWIQWFLQCLNHAFDATKEVLEAIINKATFWQTHATTVLNPRQVVMIHKLFDGFDGNLNTSKWAKLAKTSQDTALRDIQDLEAKRVLQKDAGGGRSTSYSLVPQ